MTLILSIESAFAHRVMPTHLILSRTPETPEQRDALWFRGRGWREMGWQDWEKHADAFYAFTPEAFIYYLPSILLAALNAPNRRLLAVNALIGILDRPPEVRQWDSFISKRLVGLEAEEYESLKAWILAISGRMDLYDEDVLVRAYATVDLLATETARLRSLVGR